MGEDGGEGEGGGDGGGIDKLDSWANYTEAKANFYAPASLLVPFRNDTIAQVTDLQSALNSKQNTLIAGTNITISGNTISSSGGISSVTWGDITGKPTTFVPSAHTHTFASLTNKPTTLAGYGITDGVTLDTAQTITGAKTFSTLLTASAGTNTPKVIFAAAGWSLEQVGTELQMKHNGVVKQRMLSDGTILAVGGITALTTG